ncbi:thiol reductant ABC exporter subunit CydC [Intrasporangium chromatireducens]|uniref:thiol reductant ABC exporter subunit CydC n=1 Tax=Intrasporangium chromatireducens TaxID=1386088 RepID=UPI0009DEB8E3|nr:thiol reductant ABC exporter subunit CydC [Intrasporangium chromatireducens]
MTARSPHAVVLTSRQGAPDLRPPRRQDRRAGVARPAPGIVKGGVLGGIASASGMALTATSGWLIVRAAERPIILTLMTAIVAVRAFGIARPVFRYWERLVSHDAALALLARRRWAAYDALIPLTPARLGRRRRSDVLAGVVDDLDDVVDAQVRVTVPVISSVVAGGLAILLTSWLAPAVGLVLSALAVGIALVCVVAYRLESRSLAELLAARAEVMRVSELMTSQATDLHAVGGWPTAMGWLDDAQRTLTTATRRQSIGRATASAAFLLLVGGAVVLTAVVVWPLALAAPVKALLLLTPVAVSEVITPLTDAMRALARATGSAARIDALLGLEPAVGPGGTTDLPATTGAPRLTARGLTASWTGGRTDVGPIALDVPAGSRVALTGPNGSGKSTLLAVLARHLEPTGGTVGWDGVDVTDLLTACVRDQVAIVDDLPHVFASTLRANLTLARPGATDAEVRDALRRAGLSPLLAALPAGLDTRLGEGGRGLSGGERARIAIARALLSRRPVILLDEPVAHLDPPTATAVLTDLLTADPEPGPHPTIVMATHRPEGLSLFDQVVTMQRPPE